MRPRSTDSVKCIQVARAVAVARIFGVLVSAIEKHINKTSTIPKSLRLNLQEHQTKQLAQLSQTALPPSMHLQRCSPLTIKSKTMILREKSTDKRTPINLLHSPTVESRGALHILRRRLRGLWRRIRRRRRSRATTRRRIWIRLRMPRHGNKMKVCVEQEVQYLGLSDGLPPRLRGEESST